MSATVDSFFDDYARRYTEGDVKGVTSLCLWPFLAVRKGEAIHMPDRGAVWDHFASAIAAYRRSADAEKWTPVDIDTRQLGEHSVFATVHWNALDADRQVVRDTWTSYQLLATPDGRRFLSTRITSEPRRLAGATRQGALLNTGPGDRRLSGLLLLERWKFKRTFERPPIVNVQQ
jgi:hypothetical protein